MIYSPIPFEQSGLRIQQYRGMNALKYFNNHDSAHPVSLFKPICFLMGIQPCSSRLLNSPCHELIIRTVHLLFCNYRLTSGGLLLRSSAKPDIFLIVMEGQAYF